MFVHSDHILVTGIKTDNRISLCISNSLTNWKVLPVFRFWGDLALREMPRGSRLSLRVYLQLGSCGLPVRLGFKALVM